MSKKKNKKVSKSKAINGHSGDKKAVQGKK